MIKTRNDNLGNFKNLNSTSLKSCILEIYKTVFDGALFPYEKEIYKLKKEPTILIQESNNFLIGKENNKNLLNIRTGSDTRSKKLNV